MKPRLYIPTILLALFFIADYFFIIRPSNNLSSNINSATISREDEAYVLPVLESNYYPLLDTTIPRLESNARSALVFDLGTGKDLYSKNTDSKLPIASLTKILTAITILDNFNLNDIVIVSSSSIRADGEKQDLYAGEKISVLGLLEMMLIQSSNDSAYAIAEHGKNIGIDLVKKMNERAYLLGMKNSVFYDPAGLNDNGYSTAEDLKKLLTHSIRYPEIWQITSNREKNIQSSDGLFSHVSKNTNKLFDLIPGIYGGKTGYTEEALGCMILLVDIQGQNDTKLISIILGSPERFADTKRMIDWTLSAYRWR